MRSLNHLRSSVAALAIATGALAPDLAAAQTIPADGQPGDWRFAATIYGYLPSISGTTAFPVDSGGTPVSIPVNKIVDSLKFTFMGTLDVHNGRWGAFTDVLYLNLGGDKQNTREFDIGNGQTPADTTANLGWDLKGLIWTTAGEYRVVADPGLTVDLLAGVRLLSMKQSLNWSFMGSLGPIAGPGRSGSVSIQEDIWDGIVGVKGRWAIGQSQWSVPFYFDIGTGDSKTTGQAAGGIGYGFSWGELIAMYRYIGYDVNRKGIKDIRLSGPMVGATFRF